MLSQIVILASGLNTRLYPISKVIPKALLPIQGIPAIHYAVEEAHRAGAKQVVVVVQGTDSLIERYFAPDPHLRHTLESRGKKRAVASLDHLVELGSRLEIVHQEELLGEAHALSLALLHLDRKKYTGIIFADVLYPPSEDVMRDLVKRAKWRPQYPLFQTHGRLVLSPEAFARFESADFALEENLDRNIREFFERSEVIGVPAPETRQEIGSLEDYRLAFCDFPKLNLPPIPPEDD